ncbi:MAG: protein kinase domain-containing protein [Gemmataceae bacterium]
MSDPLDPTCSSPAGPSEFDTIVPAPFAGMARDSTVDMPAIGPYTNLAPHAKGGLGEVLTATDPQLHRTVAVKRLQDKHAHNPDVQRRFLLEAEITARLEHPGVVPVYALTHDDHNSPVYAMRFIQGQTLGHAIGAYHAGPPDPLLFRRLLQTFLQVCQTVAYAHSRGVIHRDLKPQNVMLGKFGETLVVDWGLAKVVGRPEEVRTITAEETLIPESVGLGSGSETLLGSAVGTPAYMSPEQAAGRWDVVVQASDVYSLGAVLYTLLTGKPPLEKSNWPEIQQKIQQGDFPRPRQVRADVPRVLEAVCLRAMAVKPADRYSSVEALATDMEHWLADEPVAAYREPVGNRLARWGRRHRALVAGAAALLLTTVAALAVGLILLGKAGTRTEQQRQLAEDNFAEAQHQRDLARVNFQMARHAVDDYFVQVSESTLLKYPGLQPLRKQLLESALKYYQDFLNLGRDDPELQTELAQAYFRVGNITMEIGTKEDALNAYQRARDLYKTLSQDYPKNSSFRSNLAQTYRGIGRMELQTGRVGEASLSFQKAIDLGEELFATNPDVPEFQRDLALSYNNLGFSQHNNSQPKAGLRSLERAISTWKRLIKKHPDAVFQSGMGMSYSNLGWYLTLAGRMTEALEATRQAVATNAEAVRENSTDPGFRNKLGIALDNLGNQYYFADQPTQAREAYERALVVAEALARENPAVIEFQERLVLYHIDLGHLLLHAGQDDKAQKSFEAAMELGQKRRDVPPVDFSYAPIYRGLGKLLRNKGQNARALESLQKAVQIGETNAWGEKPFSTYELACARALCSALIGERKTELAREEKTNKRRYADQAMEALRQAVGEGWANAAWMKKDPDLDALRDRPDFQKAAGYVGGRIRRLAHLYC